MAILTGPRASAASAQKSVVDPVDIRSSLAELYQKYQTADSGLKDVEAKRRLLEVGPNEPTRERQMSIPMQILGRLKHPLVILLLVISSVSGYLGQYIDAALVFAMAVWSVYLGFSQEYRANQQAEKLSRMVRATAAVLRNGKTKEIPMRELVPGDIVDLSAGDMIPADLRMISGKDLFINQSSLTGESIPVEKFPVPPSADAPVDLLNLTNFLFMGTSVVSGTALALVLRTGDATQFGAVAQKLAGQNPETSFERGVRQYTWLMIRLMAVLVIVIFAANVVTKQAWLESLLFAISVAVGLTPEMLPMLVTWNLANGAIAMSRKAVIVKRLNSIQNFGAMDVLCTDKTGTLTEDKIILEKHCDVVRRDSADVLTEAYINSYHQTGLRNILDRAILKFEKLDVHRYPKVDEIPFDFSRRIMSVVVQVDGKHRLIAKGAPEAIFERCTQYELDHDLLDMEPLILADLKAEYDSLSREGFRVLAIASREFEPGRDSYSKADESGMTLKGYVAFLDPPKPGAKRAIEVLQKLGIQIKVLTGDNEHVAGKICREVGISATDIMTGARLDALTDAELSPLARSTHVFARLNPMQKERIVRVLQESRCIVGFLGDGINDAPALKMADVGISVNNAADIAKESADIILLRKSLAVLEEGVIEGRRTFSNIVKYIKMVASSNFGNMFSMTGASFLFKFLPMLPTQVLINNLLYDVSQVAIPTDEIDDEYLTKPRTWDIASIRRFIFFFGPLSSIFDYATFGVLIWVFHAKESQFQTTWFVESLFTQTLVIHVIRTAKSPFWTSACSRFLLVSSIGIVIFGLGLSMSSAGHAIMKFVVLPEPYYYAILGIVAAYLASAEYLKRWFVRKYGYT